VREAGVTVEVTEHEKGRSLLQRTHTVRMQQTNNLSDSFNTQSSSHWMLHSQVLAGPVPMP
jgi:hypothetical protein